MAKKVLEIADFRARVLQGVRPRSVVRLAASENLTAAQDNRTATFIFSDDSVDRYGDTIDARGWDTTAFNKNPVALYGHDCSKPEYVIGRAKNVRVEGNRLIGDIEFIEASINPTAETVYQMVKGGFLNAVSVGFRPLEWALSKDKFRPTGIDFKRQELMEISVVGVPANDQALVQARAAGIEVDRLGFMDEAHEEVATDLVTISGKTDATDNFFHRLMKSQPPAPKVSQKGLSEVAWLAQLLNELGYIEDVVEWEAESEGDGSAVPAMLADALQQLGAALIAMTTEEVAELFADEDAPLLVSDDVVALAAMSPAQKALVGLTKMVREEVNLRSAVAAMCKSVRAGKVVSAANEKLLRGAHEAISQGCVQMKSFIDQHCSEEDEERAAPTESVVDSAKAKRLREAEALRLRIVA